MRGERHRATRLARSGARSATTMLSGPAPPHRGHRARPCHHARRGFLDAHRAHAKPAGAIGELDVGHAASVGRSDRPPLLHFCPRQRAGLSRPRRSNPDTGCRMPRPRVNAIDPSRPTVGSASGQRIVRQAFDSASTNRNRNRCDPPSRSDTNTIAWPSGDHAGCRSHPGPLVRRVHRRPAASRSHRSPSNETARRPSLAKAGSRTGGSAGAWVRTAARKQNLHLTARRQEAGGRRQARNETYIYSGFPNPLQSPHD